MTNVRVRVLCPAILVSPPPPPKTTSPCRNKRFLILIQHEAGQEHSNSQHRPSESDNPKQTSSTKQNNNHNKVINIKTDATKHYSGSHLDQSYSSKRHHGNNNHCSMMMTNVHANLQHVHPSTSTTCLQLLESRLKLGKC